MIECRSRRMFLMVSRIISLWGIWMRWFWIMMIIFWSIRSDLVMRSVFVLGMCLKLFRALVRGCGGWWGLRDLLRFVVGVIWFLSRSRRRWSLFLIRTQRSRWLVLGNRITRVWLRSYSQVLIQFFMWETLNDGYDVSRPRQAIQSKT